MQVKAILKFDRGDNLNTKVYELNKGIDISKNVCNPFIVYYASNDSCAEA